MISYTIYKYLHVLGILFTFMGLGALWFRDWIVTSPDLKSRLRPALILHGLGLSLILVSGFGMAARLGFVRELPTWVEIKLVLWFCLGLLPMLARKFSFPRWAVVSADLALGAAAAYFAVFKVFV